MQNQVNIIADDMGNVVRQSSSNSEYGYVRLTQKREPLEQEVGLKALTYPH